MRVGKSIMKDWLTTLRHAIQFPFAYYSVQLVSYLISLPRLSPKALEDEKACLKLISISCLEFLSNQSVLLNDKCYENLWK